MLKNFSKESKPEICLLIVEIQIKDVCLFLKKKFKNFKLIAKHLFCKSWLSKHVKKFKLLFFERGHFSDWTKNGFEESRMDKTGFKNHFIQKLNKNLKVVN